MILDGTRTTRQGGRAATRPPDAAAEDWRRRLNPSCRTLGCEISRLGWHDSTRVESPTEELTIFVYDVVRDHDMAGRADGCTTVSFSIVLDGTGSFSIGADRVDFAAGTAALFASCSPAQGTSVFHGRKRHHIVDLRFEESLLRRAFGRSLAFLAPDGRRFELGYTLEPFLVGFDASAGLMRAAGEIALCPIPAGPRRRLFLLSKSIEALAEIADITSCEEVDAGRWRPSERRKIEAAKNLIDTHFQQNWTIHKLAREVGINEKKLKDGFRELVGCPVHAHLKMRRLDAAAELLLGGQNVTQAALSVGFCSLSHFSKIFRDYKGMPPSEFSAP